MVSEITDPSTGFELVTNTNVSAILNAQSPGNHYTTTAKLGNDDGRKGGSSVVDTNTKVYGTDNLVCVLQHFSFIDIPANHFVLLVRR
jgi:cellobiose dehydrogenase (acceptor)